jgi:hypothetical protein
MDIKLLIVAVIAVGVIIVCVNEILFLRRRLRACFADKTRISYDVLRGLVSNGYRIVFMETWALDASGQPHRTTGTGECRKCTGERYRYRCRIEKPDDSSFPASDFWLDEDVAGHTCKYCHGLSHRRMPPLAIDARNL